jgi:hypothetical protein
MATACKESMAFGGKRAPQSLNLPQSCELLSNYTPLTTISRVRKTCLFSGLLAMERQFGPALFILSLSRQCDFPGVLKSGFGMKAERIDTME